MVWLIVGAAVLGAIVAVLYLTVRDGIVAPGAERDVLDDALGSHGDEGEDDR